MKSVFITGTDTGVGKTWIACSLMRAFSGQGVKVVGMKPLASGAQLQDGRLRNEDALQLHALSNIDVPYDWINPYCFEPAIAPHIAAQQSGISISLDAIQHAYHRLQDLADVVIVEGVGGWAVPINASQTMADVAMTMNLPVLMVVGMRLGCLNHAILTAQAIQSSLLSLVAWVANSPDPDMPVLQENLDTLKNFIPATLASVVEHDITHSNSSALPIDLSLFL